MHPRTLAAAAGLLITLAPLPALAGESCCERLRLEALDMLQGAQPQDGATRAAGFDPATGRDTANYPRSRDVDLLHMRLELTIPDMARPLAQGVQTLTFRTFPQETASLTLDARRLTIRAVSTPSGAASFTQNDASVTITFDPPLRRNAEHELTITYDLRDPPRGMIWTLPQQGTAGKDAQLHTQGQPQTNSYWFPTFDFPSERLTTELIVLVPEGFTASSNGRLVSQTRVLRERPVAGAPARIAPMERFHWLQAQDHAPYLVSLVVGDFEVVDVSDSPSLPMPVYSPRGRAEDARRTYANTAPMLRLFERLLDEPYPFDRYAQLIARNFEAGGMENTAATTMHENAIYSESADLDHDLDPLIAHELAHQWFGDLITCNSWEHIWLNEGFATYLEALWLEERDGPDGYLRDVMENADRVVQSDRGVAPATPGMASKVYRHPWETFRRGANPYPKGASVLHMLRERLGDDLFFRALRTYVDRFRNQTVETADFRRVVEEVSGLQLEQFFEQWTARPGLPELDVNLEYQPDRRRLIFRIQQTQTIDADNPAFAFTLPIFIKNTQGPDVLIEPVIDQRSTAFQVELEGPPAFVAVAPRAEVLARVTTRQSPRQWTQQLLSGPTLIARIHAARNLRDATDAESAEALRQVALDAAANDALRTAAVRTLGRRKDVGAIRSLISSSPQSWEVRVALLDVLADFAESATASDQDLRDFCQRVFTSRLADDPSLRVRSAALWGITRLRDPQAPAILARALTVSSHADMTRQTALSALAWLKPAGALETVIPYASASFPSRLRVEAIQAIAALAEQDKDRAFAAIEAQLTTRENQPRMAAAAALVSLKDPRGIDALNKAIEATRATELVSRLEDHKAALERALQGS